MEQNRPEIELLIHYHLMFNIDTMIIRQGKNNLFNIWSCTNWVSQVALVVKNPPANAGDTRDMGSILGLGRSPRGENGNPLQYSCLENSVDRRARQAIVHRVAQSWT